MTSTFELMLARPTQVVPAAIWKALPLIALPTISGSRVTVEVSGDGAVVEQFVRSHPEMFTLYQRIRR